MNRIILIGNGFDLAHGLKTSYADFVCWYWKRRVTMLYDVRSNTSDDTLCSLEVIGETWSIFYFQNSLSIKNADGKTLYQFLNKHKDKFVIRHTAFFGNIHKSIETKGWVDIENEYYKLLEHFSIENYSEKEIEKLNNQLRYLQELLTEYLTAINEQEIPFVESIKKKIYAPIKSSDIAIEATSMLKEHIEWCNNQNEDLWERQCYYYDINAITSGDIHDVEKFKKDASLCTKYPRAYMLPERIMLLNFNYTKTAIGYLKQNKGIFSLIHIHGVIEKPESMIFGYGDEFEDKYRRLQNVGDNECLTNIKTIKYQESDNYRQVLAFIESAPFQVYIMGHSCGNSDRTLLNTLFEHKNCISIKPYYYIKDDETDNYLELVQNISRNFTDMKLMRDRVVNKMYCEPLTK
ncbi:MAG: hypothetical protein ILA39_04425 [Bacteroidaceae bacterium]|nr:hypothetical protein [Bacteroidaceae bacterium]